MNLVFAATEQSGVQCLWKGQFSEEAVERGVSTDGLMARTYLSFRLRLVSITNAALNGFLGHLSCQVGLALSLGGQSANLSPFKVDY
jgi:hypothetical protein